jgi:hypothetical protein
MEKKGIEFAKLPPVAELELAVRREAMALLERLDLVTADKRKLVDLEDDLKNQLDAILKQSGRPGFRHGWLAYAVEEMAGRKTLDKLLLMENGCPAAIVDQSYKVGKPYIRQTFRHLTEEDGDG